MPFISWGTTVPFTEKRDINFTENVPAGKTIGIFGYQPTPATLDLTGYSSSTLQDLKSKIETNLPVTVNYVQMSWNQTGTTVSDLVLGLVLTNSQDINGIQQVMTQIYTSAMGSLLVQAHMDQLNAWKAWRLNEAPENNWIVIVGVVSGIIALATVVYLVRRKR